MSPTSRGKERSSNWHQLKKLCDVFRGQKAAKVSKKLASLNIAIVSVPANMIHFFQPLDLTINGEVKRYMKDKFSTWYSDEVKQQIESGMQQH